MVTAKSILQIDCDLSRHVFPTLMYAGDQYLLHPIIALPRDANTTHQCILLTPRGSLISYALGISWKKNGISLCQEKIMERS